ncbi:MAG: zinc-binding dehydrogenase, partial [Candidatus Omnitrophota bacterium]
SDVLEWYRIKKAPLVLGHEATGEIVEVGRDVKEYHPGQRVFVSHHVPCGKCRYCLSGSETACSTLHTTNYFPGGFSEYVRVPAINLETGVLVLPDEVSYAEGTFIEPLACVVRAQRSIQMQAGQAVLILGSGISGLLHLMLARLSGAGPIIMTDISEYRLNKALELGADAVINAKEDVIAHLRKANSGRLADQVIISTGATPAFNQALAAVDRAGTILCFACPPPGITMNIPVNDFWRNAVKIIHSYGAGPNDLTEALDLLRSKKTLSRLRARLSVEKLITHRMGLKDIGLGFRLVSEGKDCIKVIIEPEE